MHNKKHYYVVARGRTPGIYRSWHGDDGAATQVDGFPNALYKGFATWQAARQWIDTLPDAERDALRALADEIDPTLSEQESERATTPANAITIYTDGSALGNPGPGGYGVVLRFNHHAKELSGGFRLTTNNRMELMACIVGLRALKRPSTVILYSDSQYVTRAMNEGWARRWQEKGWMRTKTESAKNADLWAELLRLCAIHQVTFTWVRGHSDIPDNERCHALAMAAAQQPDLPPDLGFEQTAADGADHQRLL